MAAKTPVLGGMDCDFVNEPPDSLKCLICMLVVKEPWQHGDCGRVYCRICIQEFIKVKNFCPNCRQKKPSLFKDGRSEKDVGALLVKCGNSCPQDDATCSWTGELCDLKYHHSQCPHQPLPCPNKCIDRDNSEPMMVPRSYLERHLKVECGQRPYKCPHCEEEGTFYERTGVHAKMCPKVPIQCPNSPCDTVLMRERMRRHKRLECPFAEAKCCYTEIGCSVELPRGKLTEHEADLNSHLETAKATIVTLRGRVQELTENAGKQEAKKRHEMEQELRREVVIAQDRAYLMSRGQTTFKMKDFIAHKNASVEFKSKPFYTGLRGYKMCVIIEANGAPKVHGAYVSIYAHLMKGEHDDKLPWPLVCTVTFELLNQLGDHNHRKRTCTFPPDDKDNQRVMHQEIAGAGYGCPKFISHAKLGGGGDLGKDVQYLKDDTIFLRVFVDAPNPIGHNWLKCY